MASSHKLSEPHQENLMQLHDTVACLTRSGLLANSIRYQSASSSDDLETDLGTWGPHQNSESLPLFLLGTCLRWPPKVKVQLQKVSAGLALGQGSKLPLDLGQVLLIHSELQLQLLDVVFQFALA